MPAIKDTPIPKCPLARRLGDELRDTLWMKETGRLRDVRRSPGIGNEKGDLCSDAKAAHAMAKAALSQDQTPSLLRCRLK